MGFWILILFSISDLEFFISLASSAIHQYYLWSGVFLGDFLPAFSPLLKAALDGFPGVIQAVIKGPAFPLCLGNGGAAPDKMILRPLPDADAVGHKRANYNNIKKQR